MKAVLVSLCLVLALCACTQARPNASSPTPATYPVQHTDAEWRARLDPLSYSVLRHADTERPFTGKYASNHADGDYLCAGCGNLLFHSQTKFESGTGWPSFFQPAKTGAVQEVRDDTYGMERVEVRCSQCGGHLGHVFPDGPQPTGLRYCMNSASLNFKAKK